MGDLGRVYAASILGLIALHRGDLTTGTQHWRHAEAVLAVSGPQIGDDWLLWLGALVARAEGRREEALARLLAAWGRFERDGMRTSQLRIAAASPLTSIARRTPTASPAGATVSRPSPSRRR